MNSVVLNVIALCVVDVMYVYSIFKQQHLMLMIIVLIIGINWCCETKHRICHEIFLHNIRHEKFVSCNP